MQARAAPAAAAAVVRPGREASEGVAPWRRSTDLARILIMTLGSRGDVQPYIALGERLAERGHDVTLSTGSGFDEFIEGRGMTSAPLSIDVEAMLDNPDIQAALRTLKGKWDAFRSTQDLMQRQLDEFWTIARDTKSDLIVYHPKAFIAAYIARALGTAAVPSFLQPGYVPTRTFANPLAPLPALGRFGNLLSWALMIPAMRLGYRAMLKRWFPRHPDVKARPAIDVLAGYHPETKAVLRLHAHSTHLVPKPADWTGDDHVTGAWFTKPDTNWQPSADLSAFLKAGPPPTYVGFGSMPAADAERTAATVLASLRQTGTRAIVAKGWGALSQVTADDGIHVLDSAPHDRLFPECSAVVHHGGAGTTHEGLRWGRRTLVCPVFGDQPFWGNMVASQGAGPAPLPLNRLTSDSLSNALFELQTPAYAKAAQALGAAIRQEGGAAEGARLVESMLET